VGEGDDEDRELFERALEDISRGDVYKGKYGAPSDESDEESDENEAPSERTVDQEELQRLRDQRMMESAFGEIERIDQDKYHRREPAGEAGDEVTTEDFAAAFEQGLPPEPKPEPKPAEPTLVELAGDDPETLNLRGKDPSQGVRELAVFIDLASKDAVPIVRILVGSNPDLRQALLQWFREAGALYAQKVEIIDPDADSALFVKIRPA
jgi:hypothetical protein